MGNQIQPQPYDQVERQIIAATENQTSCNATVALIDQIFGKKFGQTKLQKFNNAKWDDSIKIPKSKYLAFEFGSPDNHWVTMFYDDKNQTWILWHSWQGVFTFKGWCCLNLIEISKQVKSNPLEKPATWLKEFCDVWIREFKKSKHYDNQFNTIEKAYKEQFNANRTVKIMFWKEEIVD